MTEGHAVNRSSMCVRIWLEVGHACEPRTRSALGRAIDWRVWVRGVDGQDVSAFIHKVVFHLHPASAFVYPKRVLQEPPYEIQESGYASINIPIHVYFKYSEKPKKIKLKYTVSIENYSTNSSESNFIYYEFENPTEQLKKCLIRGGGSIIARTGGFGCYGNNFVVFLDDNGSMPHKCHAVNGFVQPLLSKLTTKKVRNFNGRLIDVCHKCGEMMKPDFKKILHKAAMTDTEIDYVSQVYWSYSSYEKSSDSLTLPPFNDPIYKIPELPLSLRECTSTTDVDYAIR